MSIKNYVKYHVHSDYSNCTTNIDSATKIDMYVEKAKSLGMTALGFSEHGNVFNWYEKKTKIEKAGMKYIHAVEMYITETLEEKVRDNRHCVLIAKNKDGFKEINKLVSISHNRNDNHYYYNPRISMEELSNISNNIMITSACLGSPLNSSSETFQLKFLDFLIKNKENCYLEIQHHNVEDQINYNKKLLKLSQEHNIPLIAGTDTHSLNKEFADARVILQKAKYIHFDNEDGWDLTFQAYDELINNYKTQNSLSMDLIEIAIENTNVMANRIEEIDIDISIKYPKLYEDSEEYFKKLVYESIDTHPYALKNHSRETIIQRIEEELPVYKETKVIDYILFQKYIRDWEVENDIFCGAGRGSISGSYIAYLLELHEMDSIKFDLNFFRFLNPSRVTNCDIDRDYYSEDRDRVREFLLTNNKIQTAEIITFGTIALKGAIRDVGRALDMPLKEVDQIAKGVDNDEEKLRKKYVELFKYVDLLNGVIVHSGRHAAGVLCSDLEIVEEIGLVSSKDTPYPVSSLDMYSLDACFWVKLDCLGLDNIGVINKTCKLVNIDKLTPDNTNLEDWEVWNSIQKDTNMIFQWESPFAGTIMKDLFSETTISNIKKRQPDLSYLKLFSFGNGLIRPGCASFRNNASKGIFYDNGLEELNELLSKELGYISMQETIMKFLTDFCGYSGAESDSVRRAIAKKKGTEKLLPEIKERFIKFTSYKYKVSKEKCEEIIEPFLQSILDASSYGFSWNHSDAYSFIGYACGYLRHYYPLEFITSCLNVFDTEEKTANIMEYIKRNKIKINSIKFGRSKAEYFFNKEEKAIYKGVASVKFLNAVVAEELYELSKNNYKSFTKLLLDINKTSIDSRQLTILIKLDYFSEFGNTNELLKILDIVTFFKFGEMKKIKKEKCENEFMFNTIEKYSTDKNTKGEVLKQFTILDISGILFEYESYIKSMKLEEFDINTKIVNQQEYLGYISNTGREEDRSTLLIKEIYPIARKKDNKQFGYSIVTYSIGSGLQSRFTIFNKDYQVCGELKKNTLIKCLKFERNGEYFTMKKYEII